MQCANAKKVTPAGMMVNVIGYTRADHVMLVSSLLTQRPALKIRVVKAGYTFQMKKRAIEPVHKAHAITIKWLCSILLHAHQSMVFPIMVCVGALASLPNWIKNVNKKILLRIRAIQRLEWLKLTDNAINCIQEVLVVLAFGLSHAK